MKKFLTILLCLGAVLIPNNASAKTYSFDGYYCDEKEDLGDGTFRLTCHLLATTDFEVNHVEGSLILKNVTLESIKTTSDWANENGLANDVSFTSDTSHSGSFSIADLIFTGNLSDTECEASFMPTLAEKITENFMCAIIDNEYYGKNGTHVTEEEYFEQCCDYVCSVVDNKYYFNSQGKSVSYDEFLNDCSTTETIESNVGIPQTGIDYGLIIIPIGIAAIVAIIKISKKNTKIYKI